MPKTNDAAGSPGTAAFELSVYLEGGALERTSVRWEISFNSLSLHRFVPLFGAALTIYRALTKETTLIWPSSVHVG